jgi:hypothetical protein
MIDFSFFTSLFQMKEIQIFFAIIIIGILAYLAIVLITGLFKWMFSGSKEEPEYKNKKVTKVKLEDLDKEEIKSESKEAAKEIKVNDKPVSFENVETDEKPVFTFAIDMVFFERAVFVLIIIAEIVLIAMNYLK